MSALIIFLVVRYAFVSIRSGGSLYWQGLAAQVALKHINRRSRAHRLRQGRGDCITGLRLEHLLNLDIQSAETRLVSICLRRASLGATHSTHLQVGPSGSLTRGGPTECSVECLPVFLLLGLQTLIPLTLDRDVSELLRDALHHVEGRLAIAMIQVAQALPQGGLRPRLLGENCS